MGLNTKPKIGNSKQYIIAIIWHNAICVHSLDADIFSFLVCTFEQVLFIFIVLMTAWASTIRPEPPICAYSSQLAQISDSFL
jgi:hypothetical protein